MEAGELLFQALLSMLCGVLSYFWFLKVFIIPAGTGVFNIDVNTADKMIYNIEESPR